MTLEWSFHRALCCARNTVARWKDMPTEAEGARSLRLPAPDSNYQPWNSFRASWSFSEACAAEVFSVIEDRDFFQQDVKTREALIRPYAIEVFEIARRLL